MRILISIGHPAHVHFFKNLFFELKKQGHFVIVTSREKDIANQLLDFYNIPYNTITKQFKNCIEKYTEFLIHTIKLSRIIKKNKVNLTLSISGKLCVWASKLSGVQTFVFDDTEHDKFAHKYCIPFADKVFTPDCHLLDLGPKQVRYAGYHELAYLHPNRFTPNPKVLKEIGLTENDKFFVVRFVSWEASHDIGQKGLSLEDKRKLIEILKPHGKIIITSEKELPEEFEEYRMSICPTKIHDLLYYATMYVGEGGTMASEAACLGTYSILINPLIAGTFEELKNKYHLLIQETEVSKIIDNVKKYFENKKYEYDFKSNHQQFLYDKIDVTQYLIDLIENEATTNSPKHSR